jgi:uncharacterized protein
MTIAVDTNVIVGAMVSSSIDHETIVEKLESLDTDFCVTPVNVGEVLRLLTHPKIFTSPLKTTKAVAAFSTFIESQNIRILEEDPDWWRGLPEIEKQIPGLKGNELFDARIALCLRANGVKKIFTLDADFKEYSFLSIV